MTPVVVEARYPEWILTQFAGLVVEAGLKGEYLVCEDLPSASACCLLLTDDLGAPPLRRRLVRLLSMVTSGRVGVLAWDKPLKVLSVVGIPGLVVGLPNEEREASVRLMKNLAVPVSEPALIVERSLPPSLSLAVRRLLRLSGDLVGGPPPPSIGDLALQVGCTATTLYRTAKVVDLELGTLNRLCRARWVRLATGQSVPAREIARRLGYSHRRSVRRLVQRAVGVPYSQLRQIPMDTLDSAILALL